jgi:outer membrane receptor for ferrienterochelin and colicins
MSPLLVLALIAVTPLLVVAQEPASITVSVRSEHNPVSNVTIEIDNRTFTSDAKGSVTINVAPGRTTIKATSPQHLPAATQLLVEAGQHYEIELELQPISHEEVTVSATRTDARLEDSPTRVEVLNREEIEEKILMTPGDIVMMLNEMGGMRVQTTSPSLGAASVRIQGMRGPYTRFLSDGLPLFGQQVGGLGLLQIPPSDLAQVEVIKGTTSALYGSGAMGGVVNLVSRRPGKEPMRELLLNQSTRGATDAVFFGSTPLNNFWGMSLLGGGHFQLRNDIDNDTWADLAGYSRGVLRPRFFWEGTNGKSLFMTSGVTIEDRKGGTLPGEVLLTTGAPYVESLRTIQFDFGGVGQTVVADHYLLALRFSAGTRRHNHLFGDVRERDHHDSYFSELTLRRTIGRHTLVAGAALEVDSYAPADVPQFSFTDYVPGLFLQDDIVLAPWLSLSASARLDHHSEYGNFLSPRIAALFRKGPWSSRISLGQGFFGPTPLTEETEAAGLTRLLIHQPLKAERGRSASLDLTRTLGAATVTATFFGTSIRNPINVDAATYSLVNLPEPTRNFGAELLGTIRLSPISITGSYTFVRARQTEATARVDAPLTPVNSAGIVGMWESEEKGRVGVEIYYTGKQRLEDNPFRSESRPYVIVGFLVERKLGPVRAFINAENITGVRQTRWDPLLRPTRATSGRWTVDAWAPLDGRVFNGGVRWHF